MSTLKVNNLQVGQHATATNNFTLYQPAVPDGTVRLGYGNAGSVTDSLTFTNSGRLGIGTAPTAKLDVLASTGETAINSRGWIFINSTTVDSNWNSQLRIDGNSSYRPKIVLASTTGYRWSIRNDDPVGNGELKFRYEEGSLDAVTISRNGNVGIGTTDPGTSRLDVVSNSASGYIAEFNQANTSNSAQILINSPTNGESRPVLIDMSRAGVLQWSIGQAYLDTNNSFHIATSTLQSGNTGSRLCIKTDGNVGIGTTNPQYRFHVHGRACITDGTGTNQSLSVGTTSSSTGTNFGTIDVNGNMYSAYYLRNNNNSTFNIFAAAEQYVDLGTITNIPLHFKVNDTRMMSIVAGGNVGIGTTNPSRKLHVIGDIRQNYSTRSSGGFGVPANGGIRTIVISGLQNGCCMFHMGAYSSAGQAQMHECAIMGGYMTSITTYNVTRLASWSGGSVSYTYTKNSDNVTYVITNSSIYQLSVAWYLDDSSFSQITSVTVT